MCAAPSPELGYESVGLFPIPAWGEAVCPVQLVVPIQDRRWGQVAGCQVRLSLLMALPFPPTEFQDDTRLNHDALPERTVVQLDASPR